MNGKNKENKTEKLLQEIARNLTAMNKAVDYHDEFVNIRLAEIGKNKETAIVMAEILSGFYQPLETMFLKISAFFENDLPHDRWHKQLLKNMTIQISNVRERVISDETCNLLSELLKFRHFKRYYTGFNYEWNRLEQIDNLFRQLQPLLINDITHFTEFLKKMDNGHH